MSRLYAGIIAFCLFSVLCAPSLIHAQNIGTVRLREARPIFQDYAVFEPNSKQYVRAICQTGEYPPPAKPTIELVYPLFTVPAGETLTITTVLPCYDTRNGYFVQVITKQDGVGITQLPNYQNLVQTTNDEGAFQVLSLYSDCGGDPECIINQFAEPYRQFTKRYSDSKRVAKAAEISARYYKDLAREFQAVADNPAVARSLHHRYSTYSRDTLLAKAKEYSALRAEMNALELQAFAKQRSAQPPAPQQTASTQSTARPATPPSTAPTKPPPSPPARPPSQSDLFTIFSYGMLIVCTLAYIISHRIRYTRILTHIPAGEIGHSMFEGIMFLLFATAIAYAVGDFLKPFVAIVFALFLLHRLERRLEPARQQRAEAELARHRETLKALIPLLDQLHRTYGRYSDYPEFVPPSWYQPRKHYIEYMAYELYTFYKAHLPHYLDNCGITADSHPLAKLRRLSFPTFELHPDDLGNPRHPYTVVLNAITDPEHRAHHIFRNLIPHPADLLSSLKEERWRQPFARQAEELDTLVTQEIINQRYTIIGFPNPAEHPFPIFYCGQRFRHTYVIGKTGSGKSTLLRNLIAQDIHHGNGLIVLSPENDLFEKLLAFIPAERKDDLIYFDPTDTKPPIIGFNPLTLETGEDLTQKAGETMTALKRALGDLGVTMEPLIQNAVYALLQRPHSTFSDLARLIDPYDAKLRAVVKNDPNTDEATRAFWQRYERSTYYQKSHEAVLNRLNPFFRPPISTILATPSLSFKTELNQDRRIIFLNLSRLRGMEAATVGQLLLAEIQQSLLVRDEIPESQRIPYYLYIDEFQTYAGDSEQSLINILNGARKYKLGITLAHQTTSDIPSKLLSTIVGNVGTVISLQIAAEDAPFFARELQIRKDGKDSYSPEALQNLTTGYGYARTPNQSHGVSIAIPATPVVSLPSPIPTDELKRTSKHNFGLMPKTEPLEPDTDAIFDIPRAPAVLQPAPEPAKHAEEEADTATAVAPLDTDEPVAEASPSTEPVAVASPAKRKRPATPRKPVIRKTIKKKSLIPDEHIEID